MTRTEIAIRAMMMMMTIMIVTPNASRTKLKATPLAEPLFPHLVAIINNNPPSAMAVIESYDFHFHRSCWAIDWRRWPRYFFL